MNDATVERKREPRQVFVLSVGYYGEEAPLAAFDSRGEAVATLRKLRPDFKPYRRDPEALYFEGGSQGAIITPVVLYE